MEPTTRPVLWHDLRPTLTDELFIEKIQNMLEHGIPLHTEREIRSLSSLRPDLLIQELSLLSSVKESVAAKGLARYATVDRLLTDYMSWLLETSEQYCAEFAASKNGTTCNVSDSFALQVQNVSDTLPVKQGMIHIDNAGQEGSELPIIKDLAELTNKFIAIQSDFQAPLNFLYNLEVSKINQEGSLLSSDTHIHVSESGFDLLLATPQDLSADVTSNIARSLRALAAGEEEQLHSCHSHREPSYGSDESAGARQKHRALHATRAALRHWAADVTKYSISRRLAVRVITGRSIRSRLRWGLAAWYTVVQCRRRSEMLNALLRPRLSDLPKLRAVVRHAGALPLRRSFGGGATGECAVWDRSGCAGGFRMRWGYSGHGLAVAVSAFHALRRRAASVLAAWTARAAAARRRRREYALVVAVTRAWRVPGGPRWRCEAARAVDAWRGALKHRASPIAAALGACARTVRPMSVPPLTLGPPGPSGPPDAAALVRGAGLGRGGGAAGSESSDDSDAAREFLGQVRPRQARVPTAGKETG